ncbi:hypothetical protein [uncultured Roseovarius sp.]|uniref:hypothetical protein n=1 Tax=uncultured Roseovarius sp. TaxID=293344 RepID=UPI00259217E4|nr:hypothetical protein [uncultured Roseovarius sp.]
MKHHAFTISLFGLFLLGTVQGAQAATVNATSDLNMLHSYTVNSGSVPAGVRLSLLAGALALGENAASSVDDPTAINSTIPFAQVANPFTDPPIPYIAQRVDRSTINGGLDGSQAQYDMSATSVDDPDANPLDTSIVERTVDTSGAARVFLSAGDVAASAHSDFLLDRGFSFVNESGESVSFNITGEVTASFLASHDGMDGFARASGNLFLEFADMIGTQVDYLPLAPYLRTIEDGDAGASVTEQLVTSGGAFDGFNFSAATTAIADGSDTTASFDASFRYMFRVQMDPGARFNLMTGARQANAVEYTPQLSPVPLPASLPVLGSAFLMLAAIRVRRRKRG